MSHREICDDFAPQIPSAEIMRLLKTDPMTYPKNKRQILERHLKEFQRLCAYCSPRRYLMYLQTAPSPSAMRVAYGLLTMTTRVNVPDPNGVSTIPPMFAGIMSANLTSGTVFTTVLDSMFPVAWDIVDRLLSGFYLADEVRTGTVNKARKTMDKCLVHYLAQLFRDARASYSSTTMDEFLAEGEWNINVYVAPVKQQPRRMLTLKETIARNRAEDVGVEAIVDRMRVVIDAEIARCALAGEPCEYKTREEEQAHIDAERAAGVRYPPTVDMMVRIDARAEYVAWRAAEEGFVPTIVTPVALREDVSDEARLQFFAEFLLTNRLTETRKFCARARAGEQMQRPAGGQNQ